MEYAQIHKDHLHANVNLVSVENSVNMTQPLAFAPQMSAVLRLSLSVVVSQ